MTWLGDKDVICAEEAKVIGGYLNGGKHARKEGVATRGSPTQKRLGLSAITFELCQLPCTTDQLHLLLEAI